MFRLVVSLRFCFSLRNVPFRKLSIGFPCRFFAYMKRHVDTLLIVIFVTFVFFATECPESEISDWTCMSFLSAQETTCKCCFVLSFRYVVFVTECSDLKMFDWICMSFLSVHGTTCGFVSSHCFTTLCFRCGMFRFWSFRLDVHVGPKRPRNDMRSCSALFVFFVMECSDSEQSDRVYMSFLSAWGTTCRCCVILLFRYVFSIRKVSFLFFLCAPLICPTWNFCFR